MKRKTARHFVCEFVSGGGMRAEDLPPSLCHEAVMMRDMILDELGNIADTEISTTHDDRLPSPEHCQSTAVTTYTDIWQLWHDHLNSSDYCWLIAPETRGILYQLHTLARQCNTNIIGCTPAAVALCADKLALGQYLQNNGITAVRSQLWQPGKLCQPFFPVAQGWAVKPRQGAGCEACYRLQSATTAQMARQIARENNTVQSLLLQEWLPGEAISLSILFQQQRAIVLSCNKQIINVTTDTGKLSLQGLHLNAFADLREIFQQLANNIAAIIPGLHGFAGIDLIWHHGKAVILEINPRLTTAFTAMNAATDQSIVQLLLDVHLQGTLPAVGSLAEKSVYLSLV